MIVEVIQKVKEVVTKKHILNYVSMIVSVFFMFSALNTFAAECIDVANLPKIDVVKGYQSETELTKSATGDPSYNAQTTTMNIVMGAANGTLQNLAPQTLSTYQAIKDNPNIPTYAKGGALGAMDNAVYSMFNNFEGINIPNYLASEWVPGFDSGSNSIYAASDGYGYLQESNIDGLWDRLRLISYVFFVVILIVAGFMIMFRQKIGGQLAVSVFNVLPNVIISLILVTFSFAIVGLLLNFGVLAVNVVSSVLGVTADSAITVDSPFSLIGSVLSGKVDVTGGNAAIAGVGTTAIAALVGILAAITGATGGVAVVAGIITFLFIGILIAAIVIYASVRVYITILTAYLSIIFNTILGPLFLTIAAFPGQSYMITDWLNKVLKGVLTFPLVYFFLNLGAFIMSCEINISFPSGLMSGDFANVATGSDSLVGWFLKAFVVIGLFFFAADSPKLLDDFLVVNGGKAAAGAVESVKKGLSRIPLVGSFFG